MFLPQSSPDAVKDAQGPRQYHVAALQPAVNERVQEHGSGGAEKGWRNRRSPAVKASFLVRTGQHCTASSGTIRAHGTHTRTNKKVRWQQPDTGDKGPHDLAVC
ncbi:hypothetical protein TcG_10675 [Trypanosoma cruzi]|nr:hypothetical protein TcG_10675 [Trypanosoma cruzi]